MGSSPTFGTHFLIRRNLGSAYQADAGGFAPRGADRPHLVFLPEPDMVANVEGHGCSPPRGEYRSSEIVVDR